MKKPAAALKRPALGQKLSARPLKACERCRGLSGEKCIFNQHLAGAEATVNPGRQETHCVFCNPWVFNNNHSDTKSRKITRHLGAVLKLSASNFERALGRIAAFKGRAVADEYRRRIARTASAPSEDKRCMGHAGGTCIFAVDDIGCAARVQHLRGELYCLFCDGDVLRQREVTRKGQDITNKLCKLYGKDWAMYGSALRRLEYLRDAAFAEEYDKRRQRALHRRAQRVQPITDAKAQWKAALKHRRSVVPKPSRLIRAQAKNWRKEDHRRRQRKFKGCFGPDDPDRDTWQSETAQKFEHWATYGSWAQCSECHRLQPRPLQPIDLSQPGRRKATIAKCKHCAHGIGYAAPRIEDIPEELRKLTDEALEALRPLWIDVGPYERHEHGYRVHTGH